MIQIWLNYGSPYSHNLAMDQVLDFHVQSSLNGFFYLDPTFPAAKKMYHASLIALSAAEPLHILHRPMQEMENGHWGFLLAFQPDLLGS